VTLPIASQTLEDVFRGLEGPDIHRWIADRRQEDLTLDFKTAPRLLDTGEERKVLAKAISGFSNSSGGVIVWGVDAREDPATKVDAAIAPIPLSEPERFLSNLTRYAGTAVSPPASRVVHRLVTSKEFALTLVPESDSGPHMSTAEHRYFKRSGDSFRPMEHYDIVDMIFGRRRRPQLELSASVDGNRIKIGIRNVGRVSAIAPYVALRASSPWELNQYGIDGNSRWNLQVQSHAATPMFGGGRDLVIHPETTMDVCVLQPPLGTRPTNEPRSAAIEYDIAAEDFPLITRTLSVDLSTGQVTHK
jgi:hypothetical protein